jgi:1-acyl-sn-glycerol-3-phosphate acyltransferase
MDVGSRVRQAARAGGFVGLTAAMLPSYAVRARLTPEVEQRDVRDRWVGRWSSALLSIFAIKLHVEGIVPPPTPGRGRLAVMNHRSAIDIGILLHVVGGKMVSRADLAGWPLVGPAARIVGTIFVDRKSSQSGVAAIRTMEAELRHGETVNIFPEGTTFMGDEVRPFHRGGFVSARAAAAEILPLGIAYEKSSGAAFFNETFMAHLGRMSAASRPTRVVLAVGSPFDANATSAALARKSEEEVGRLVKQARELLHE